MRQTGGTWGGGMRAAALVGALLPAASLGAQTQTSSPGAGATLAADPKLELRGVEDTLAASDEQRRKIEAEIETIRNDRARLVAALLATTEKVSDGERALTLTEARLDTMTGSEDAIRRSLESRRDVIAEVLASLQRMGRRPPPALLVAPEDMLAAIRTSMMLGALLPEMRDEVDALAGDLADLRKVRVQIAAERDTLAHETADVRLERVRLNALVDARQSALAAAEQALGAERARAQDLARQASNLRDLIAKVEAGSNVAHPPDGPASGPSKDPARLAPAVAFAEAKGSLRFPVAGTSLKSFGMSDGFGGSEKGISIETRANAVVAAPADGWVAYAGPYRSYGELLILNAGQGYYIVLAGMQRINVDLGQFVLAGEPVAVMGDGSAKTAAAVAIGAAQPVLYIEFRKDGTAIDPGPWWAKPELQRVRG